MADRIFAPALVFIALFGAAFAVGSAWFDSRHSVQVVQLPSVEVHVVRLPSVNIVAKRALPQRMAMAERAAASDAAARSVQ